MSNLEPIEDADLDLEKKFVKGEKPAEDAAVENKKETPDFVLEKVPARNALHNEAGRPEKSKEGAAEKEKAYTKILSKVQTTSLPADDSAIAADAKSTSEVDGEEAKIETLIKLASTKGVTHAVKVARHLEDNYALDEFHDRLLADELHDALVKKGLIKEI